MARTTLRIPIRPHLVRYIQVHLRQADLQVIKLDSNSPLGGWLMGLVEPVDKLPRQIPGFSYAEVDVPDRDERGGNYNVRRRSFLAMNPVNVERFNDFVEWLMRKELYDRLALIEERGENHQRNGKQKLEIERFIKKYSTEGAELTYDALKKGYQRYKTDDKVLVDQLV